MRALCIAEARCRGFGDRAVRSNVKGGPTDRQSVQHLPVPTLPLNMPETDKQANAFQVSELRRGWRGPSPAHLLPQIGIHHHPIPHQSRPIKPDPLQDRPSRVTRLPALWRCHRQNHTTLHPRLPTPRPRETKTATKARKEGG